MDDGAFWALIDSLPDPEDDDELEVFKDRVMDLPLRSRRAFVELFDAHLDALNTPIHRRAGSPQPAMSDDDFEGVRYFIIGMGRAAWLQVLDQPAAIEPYTWESADSLIEVLDDVRASIVAPPAPGEIRGCLCADGLPRVLPGLGFGIRSLSKAHERAIRDLQASIVADRKWREWLSPTQGGEIWLLLRYDDECLSPEGTLKVRWGLHELELEWRLGFDAYRRDSIEQQHGYALADLAGFIGAVRQRFALDPHPDIPRLPFYLGADGLADRDTAPQLR